MVGIIEVRRAEKMAQLMCDGSHRDALGTASVLPDPDKTAVLDHHAVKLAAGAGGVMRMHGKQIPIASVISRGIFIAAADIYDGKLRRADDPVAVFIKACEIHIFVRGFQRGNSGAVILRGNISRRALRMLIGNRDRHNAVVFPASRRKTRIGFLRRIKVKASVRYHFIIIFKRFAGVGEADFVPIGIRRMRPLLSGLFQNVGAEIQIKSVLPVSVSIVIYFDNQKRNRFIAGILVGKLVKHPRILRLHQDRHKRQHKHHRKQKCRSSFYSHQNPLPHISAINSGCPATRRPRQYI